MTTANQIKVNTSQELAINEAAQQGIDGTVTRAIVARFKNPARAAYLNIPATAWHNLSASGVPENYRAILEAVLDSAAKAIISKQLSSYSVWPSTLDAGLFCEAALIDEATGANSDWMNKEELEQAWRNSATRAKWVKSPNYAANAAFRKAVAHYESLITKMAGKTSSYTPQDLDLILAKMEPSDLTTDFGSFIVRRIEAIKNRPNRVEVVDMDML